MRLILIPLLVAACAVEPSVVVAQSSPPPAPVPSAAKSPLPNPQSPDAPIAVGSADARVDPAVTARAADWLHRVQTANIDRSQLDARMNALLTDELTKQVAAQYGPLGEPQQFKFVEKKSVAGSIAYVYHAKFTSGSLYWIFSIDDAGKVNGLRFLPG